MLQWLNYSWSAESQCRTRGSFSSRLHLHVIGSNSLGNSSKAAFSKDLVGKGGGRVREWESGERDRREREGKRERTGREVTGLGTLRAAPWLLHTLTSEGTLEKRVLFYLQNSFPTSHEPRLWPLRLGECCSLCLESPSFSGSASNLPKPYRGLHLAPQPALAAAGS